MERDENQRRKSIFKAEADSHCGSLLFPVHPLPRGGEWTGHCSPNHRPESKSREYSSVTIRLSYDAPKLTSVKSSGAVQVTLKWNAVPGAYGGYAIYRSESKDGTYKKIRTITDCYTLTCTDKQELKTGTRYYYKICTYNSDFKYKYGNFSSILSAVPTPAQLKPTAKAAGYTSVKISWKKEAGITGYRIYQSSCELHR